MFRSLLFTGMIIEFSQVGAGFIDGIIISRFLGPEAMAGEGIAHPVFSITGMLGGLIATGMQVTCSQLMGKGNIKDVNRFFSQSFYFGMVLSVIISAVLIIFSEQFVVLFGARGNAESLIQPASQYLKGIGAGIPAIIATSILEPAFQLDSGRKLIQIGAIIMGVSDIVFDLFAVYFDLGILGIGLATAASSYLNFLFLCTHFFKKDCMLRFVKPDIPLRDFLVMMLNGSEKVTRRLSNIIRPIALNLIIISYGGTVAMSALSMRNNFTNFAEIASSGIAQAVSLLSGMYYGEINEEAISEVKSCGWRFTARFSVGICLILLIFAKPIASLYISDDVIMPMVVFALRILGLQIAFMTLIRGRIFYLQAICKPINMNLLTFLSQLVFIVLSAFVLGKLFGVYGILSSFLVSDALSLAVVYVFYQIKKKKFLLNKKDLLNLPPSFNLHPGDVISFDVRNMIDVSLTSEQIHLFCKGHNCDSKISYFAALVFEEIARNIIQYGFPDNKKKNPVIDLRVVAMDDKLVIRIRDDCPYFNITKIIAEINQNTNNHIEGFGIRITSKIAQNIEYTHAFETNNIIITYGIQTNTAVLKQ